MHLPVISFAPILLFWRVLLTLLFLDAICRCCRGHEAPGHRFPRFRGMYLPGSLKKKIGQLAFTISAEGGVNALRAKNFKYGNFSTRRNRTALQCGPSDGPRGP